ncbi:MAG: hypothetical protein IIB46_07900 [Nitrospinae bacterium]|nr:hypothetical protein [Nitrospinota bacterium]
MKKNKLASVEELSREINLSDRRIQQLVKEGVLNKEGRGKYDLLKCSLKLIKHYQAIRDGKDTESLDGKKEKARLTKLQADKVGIEVEILLEKFIELDLVEQHLSRVFASIRQKCLSLPTKIAPSIQAKRTVASIKKVLETEITEILNELCNYDPSREPARSGKSVPGNKKKRGKAKTTAKANGK